VPLSKSANVSRSYSKNKSGTVFLRHGVYKRLHPCPNLWMKVRSEASNTNQHVSLLLALSGNDLAADFGNVVIKLSYQF